MRLVKLDAIDSTNRFLKELIRTESVENYTLVTAFEQTQGRGQMGSKWASEPGKNVIMSLLVKDFLTSPARVFDLNVVFSLAVLRVLQKHQIPDVHVKWPNDILSGNKKIGGILIENTLKSDTEIQSVVGLGLNVNQTEFSHLPQASSLQLVSGQTFQPEELAIEITQMVVAMIQAWPMEHQNYLSAYTASLFKIQQVATFKAADQSLFTGKIIGTNALGKLLIQTEQGVVDFDIKEVQLLY